MPQPGKPSGKSKPRVIAATPSLNTESAIGEVVTKARRLGHQRDARFLYLHVIQVDARSGQAPVKSGLAGNQDTP